MINTILNILNAVAFTISIPVLFIIHLLVWLIPILFLYWCIPTLWEKIEDWIDDYKDKKLKAKIKAMTKKEEEEYYKNMPITIPCKLNEREKIKRKQRKWDKKHPIISKIINFYNEFIRLIWYRVPDYPLDIKCWIIYKFQRAKRGWSVQDTWGFYYHLSTVITEGCKHLRKFKHGIPGDLMTETSDMPMKKYNIKFKEAQKKWDIILNKIIKTFETAQKICDNEWYYQKSETYSYSLANKYKKINKKMKKRNSGLWKRKDLYVMTKKECQEYDEGWKLFQDNFYNLSD